ncbi:unnamed protein product [Leptidea sinapis]|uniref:Uncharacterized protein n=1 Tax=Leptidea sinapis TaxID=189913 RepID=A0A5E4Q674_9NEOP|nr:unnamed protein product [Leptidea sinapis]
MKRMAIKKIKESPDFNKLINNLMKAKSDRVQKIIDLISEILISRIVIETNGTIAWLGVHLFKFEAFAYKEPYS